MSADVAASQRVFAAAIDWSSSPPQPASTPTTSNEASRNDIDSGTSVPYQQSALERFEKEDDDAENGRNGSDGADRAHGRPAVDPGLVNRRVALPAGEQPPVDREGGGAREHEGNREAAPEEKVTEPRIQRARDDEHERVVHDLHHGDADRVRCERNGGDGGEREAGP